MGLNSQDEKVTIKVDVMAYFILKDGYGAGVFSNVFLGNTKRREECTLFKYRMFFKCRFMFLFILRDFLQTTYTSIGHSSDVLARRKKVVTFILPMVILWVA